MKKKCLILYQKKFKMPSMLHQKKKKNQLKTLQLEYNGDWNYLMKLM